MSYLTNYATRRLQSIAAASNGVRVDEDRPLNLRGHHGSAGIRVFVEDTTGRGELYAHRCDHRQP